MALTKKEKEQQLITHPKCYICDGLNLKHASFSGYDDSDIQFDHWRAKSLVGDKQADLVANQLPVHAAKDGDNFTSENFEKSAKRNCHLGKGNSYDGRDWVDFVGIYRRTLKTDYSDDLFPARKPGDIKYQVDVVWNEKKGIATFEGTNYPLMEQLLGDGDSWVSFSTVVKPSLLWVDRDVQSRPADKKRMAEMAWHLKSRPLLSPILCRYSGKKLLVFDGNHRLSSFVIARENHPIPVTIFKGPEPQKFLEVVAEAHDKLTQKKYQYSDKALKFSAISGDEISMAMKKYGNEASEVKAWEGLTKANVKLRLIGRVITHFEDNKNPWRHKWKKAGLTDASFKWMIEYYSNINAVADSFDSDAYLRESELENLLVLFSIFDEELFDQLVKVKDAKSSLKTKWWKLAHKRMRMQLSTLVKISMKLDNTPDKPCYAPVWDSYIKAQVRIAVTNWLNSPVWLGDTTANNEPDVDAALTKGGFTESYLFT